MILKVYKTLIIFVLPISVIAQVIKFNNEAEIYFSKAIEKFEESNYDSSLIIFESLINLPVNHRSTASWIMLSKNYQKLGKYKESIEIAKEFLNKFPQSSYIDDTYFTLGYSQYKDGDYINSFYSLLNLMMITNDKKLYRNAITLLKIISSEKLSDDVLKNIAHKNENKEIYDLIIALYSKKLYDSGNVKASRDFLRRVIERPTSNKFRDFVSEIWKIIQNKFQLEVGVLVPLMSNYSDSPFSEVGNDILAGIKMSVEEFNSNQLSDYEIVLDIRDTERMPSKAANEFKNLIEQNDKILCVIGPVFSNEAFLCAELAQKNKIIMITPTATANGIASIGNFIFQANPDYKNRGLALARIAVKYLKLINLAVIAPDEQSSRSVVENFIKEATELGANIVSTQYYEKNAQDLSEQFLNLRKIGANLEPIISFSNKINTLSKIKIIRAGVDAKFLDSLIESGSSIGVNRLFGKRGRTIADSLGIVYSYQNYYTDSSDFEVNSIHGILFPISSPEDISIIVPQLSYYNIKTVILGTSEWYDENELKKNRNYLDNIVFISEFYINEGDERNKNFIENYKIKYKNLPTKHSYYGYDIMNLIITLIKQGSINSELLRKSLLEVRDFNTIHSKITFSDERVNTQFNILKFSNGKIQKVGDIK